MVRIVSECRVNIWKTKYRMYIYIFWKYTDKQLVVVESYGLYVYAYMDIIGCVGVFGVLVVINLRVAQHQCWMGLPKSGTASVCWTVTWFTNSLKTVWDTRIVTPATIHVGVGFVRLFGCGGWLVVGCCCWWCFFFLVCGSWCGCDADALANIMSKDARAINSDRVIGKQNSTNTANGMGKWINHNCVCLGFASFVYYSNQHL